MSKLINNSFKREEKLKEIIKSLHEGKTVDEVKGEFEKYFGNVSTSEISKIEQALVKEGLAIEEIQRLCDVHASVFKGSIDEIHASKDYSKILGHPVNILIEENKAIIALIDNEINPAFENYQNKPNATAVLLLRIGFERLSEIDKHYARKEYAMFPYLEKHGITAPPKVMWGVDDEIRRDIKFVNELLGQIDFDEELLKKTIESALNQVKEMVFKENNILIPLMSDVFTLFDWIRIDEATPEFGYTLITPKQSWKVEQKETIEVAEEQIVDEIKFDAGSLSPKEINAIFNTLPVDLTFVDATDKVKYFSQASERIFMRPLSVIGRDVSLCHPPASVNVVEKILNSFKNGEKDHEDFWIRLGEMFVYIRYYAVRAKDGTYLGTLEVSQNIKPITELVGEKRLLNE